MKRWTLLLLTIVVVTILNSSILAESNLLLYDVDFSSPPHTVGQPPVTGTCPAPRETPTRIIFAGLKAAQVFEALNAQLCQIIVCNSWLQNLVHLKFEKSQLGSYKLINVESTE